MDVKKSNKKVEKEPINKSVTKSTVDKAKDKALTFKEYTITNKKYAIVIGSLIVFTIIVFIVTTIIYSKTAAKSQYYVDYAAAYGRAITDLRNEHRSNDFSAVFDENTKRVDVNGAEYSRGLRTDMFAEWSKHDEKFMEFIRPAFEYENGNEYNENRDKFREQLGYTNRFLTLVMTRLTDYKKSDGTVVYYADAMYAKNATDPDIAAQNACDDTNSSLGNDWFKSYLIGPVPGYEETGAYNYIAKIQAVVIASDGTQVKTTFMASYTMTDDEDGNPHMSNFECWPVAK